MKLTQLGSNQTLLLMPSGEEFFFSYETCVAGYTPGEGYFKTSTKYSRTTSKHINQYLEGVNATVVQQSDIETAMLTYQCYNNRVNQKVLPMHLVQVCDLLTREVRWTNIYHSHPVESVNVLKAYDWAAIARIY